MYFFGPFSPAPLATIMIVFFFGMQRSVGVALMVYGTTAVLQLAGMVVNTMGWIADRGLVPSDLVSARNKLLMAGLAQVVFALVFFLARAVHRAVVDVSGKPYENLEAELTAILAAD